MAHRGSRFPLKINKQQQKKTRKEKGERQLNGAKHSRALRKTKSL